MDIEAFERLLETYGTASSRWPAALRDRAIELQATDAGRQAVLRHRALDRGLDQYTVKPDLERLEQRIMQRVRASRSPIERLIDWLLPDTGAPATLWRPALAATLPLVFGVVLGSSLPIDSTEDTAWTEQDALVLMGLVGEDETMESLP